MAVSGPSVRWRKARARERQPREGAGREGGRAHLVVVAAVPLLDPLEEVGEGGLGGGVLERRQPVLEPKLDDERRLPRPSRELLGEAGRLDLSGVALQPARDDLERLRAVLPGAVLVHRRVLLPQAESTAGRDHRVVHGLLRDELLAPPELAQQRLVTEALHPSDAVAVLERHGQRTRLARVVW